MIILDENGRIDLSTLESSYAIILNPFETSKNALYISDTLNEQIVYANKFRKETCGVKAGGTVIVRKHDNIYYCSGDVMDEPVDIDPFKKEVRLCLRDLEEDVGRIWKYVNESMFWVYVYMTGICFVIYLGALLIRNS